MKSNSRMNEDQSENRLKASQILVDKGEYEEALSILETMDCVMAFWLKGIIYFSVAEKLSKSFEFIFYVTNDIKLKYTNLLNEAYDNLYKAVLLLPSAKLEIREYLNQYLWNKISKVEHELANNKTMVDYRNSDSFDDEIEEHDGQQNTDYLVNQIINWSL